MPEPVALLVQLDHLVADDLALGVEVGGVEDLLVLVPGGSAGGHRRQLQVAEDTAEGDVALVVEAGVAPHRDAPLVLSGDDLAPGGLVERPGDVDAGNLGAEARQDRLYGKRHQADLLGRLTGEPWRSDGGSFPSRQGRARCWRSTLPL